MRAYDTRDTKATLIKALQNITHTQKKVLVIVYQGILCGQREY